MMLKNIQSKIIAVIIIGTILSISPIFFILGINYTLVVSIKVLFIILFIIFFPKKFHFSNNGLILLLLLLVLALITAIHYSNDYRIFAVSVFFSVSVIYVEQINFKVFKIIIKACTKLAILFLVGAWLSFFYSLFGGQPFFEFSLPDGRPTNLFLFSLSNIPNYIWQNIGFIRPSAIFDEPGAFSFFLCFTSIMRKIFTLNRTTTWLILLFGIITFSLAHVIYIFFHALSELKLFNLKKFVISLIILFTIYSIGNNSKIGEAFDRLLFSRFDITENGTIQGDNRTGQLIMNYKELNVNNFFWGLDEVCIFNVSECTKAFPGIGGENPLAPLLLRGIFISWPYYLVVSILIFIGLKRRKNLVLFSLALLFFQRPYIMNIGYAYFALIPLYAHYFLNKKMHSKGGHYSI